MSEAGLKWMPDAWVPTEPGGYWVRGKVAVIPVDFKAELCTVVKYGNSLDGLFVKDYEIDQGMFKDYWWCPIPSPPPLPGEMT